MDPKIIIRAIAVALLTGSVLACAIEVGRLGAGDNPDRSTNGPSDPFSSELLRCTKLGAEASNDAACQAAWAKNRRHFFGMRGARSGDQPDLFPTLRKALPTKAPPKTELDRVPLAPVPDAIATPGATREGR
jgi:conjugative transfer region protein TrbK